MRIALIPLVLASLAACTQTVAETAPPLAAAPAPAADGYDLTAQLAKLAVIEMEPDTSYLSAEERQVVNLLIDASDLMSEIYLAPAPQERRCTKVRCQMGPCPRRATRKGR